MPVQEIFRRAGHWSHRGDIASDSEGIELTAYQRLGTIHLARPVIIQRRSGSDPSEVANTTDLDVQSTGKISVKKDSTLRRTGGSHATVTRSHSSLYGLTRPCDNLITHPLNRTSSHGHLSFEQMCRANESTAEPWGDDVNDKNNDFDRQGVELLSQRDLTRLQPLLWLEVTAVFDKFNVPLVKRKPNKRRRKGKYY